VICIVYSSILPVLARAVLWVSIQSVFPYLLLSLVCCSSSLIEGVYYVYFGNLHLNFKIKIIYFPGAIFQLEPFLINCLFLLRDILKEQGGADRRKGAGNCKSVSSETCHRIKAIAVLNISILLQERYWNN
jgi:hypothetical protein